MESYNNSKWKQLEIKNGNKLNSKMNSAVARNFVDYDFNRIMARAPHATSIPKRSTHGNINMIAT